MKKSRLASTFMGSTLLRAQRVCVTQRGECQQSRASQAKRDVISRVCTAGKAKGTDQRVPPLMRIFFPASALRSSTVTCDQHLSGADEGQ